jgi:hypothetical protein
MVGLLGGLLGTRKNRNVAPATPQDDGYVSKDKTGEPLVEENAPNKKPEFEYKHVIGCIELPKNCPCTDEQSLPLLLAVWVVIHLKSISVLSLRQSLFSRRK